MQVHTPGGAHTQTPTRCSRGRAHRIQRHAHNLKDDHRIHGHIIDQKASTFTRGACIPRGRSPGANAHRHLLSHQRTPRGRRRTPRGRSQGPRTQVIATDPLPCLPARLRLRSPGLRGRAPGALLGRYGESLQPPGRRSRRPGPGRSPEVRPAWRRCCWAGLLLGAYVLVYYNLVKAPPCCGLASLRAARRWSRVRLAGEQGAGSRDGGAGAGTVGAGA